MAEDAATTTNGPACTDPVDGPTRHRLQIDLTIWHRGSIPASVAVNRYVNHVEAILRQQMATAIMTVGHNIASVGLTKADVAARINSRISYDLVDEAELAEQLAGQAAFEQGLQQQHDQEVAAALRSAGKLS